MAYNSAFYDIEVKDAIEAYLRPKDDWDRLVLITDRTVGNLAKVYGNNTISGLAPTNGTTSVTVASGSAFCGGVYVESTANTTYNFTVPITNGTYKVYIIPLDKKAGTFQIAYTAGSLPSNGTYIADVTFTSDAITALVDKRTTVPTPANHNHTGSEQGPQLNNASIAASAAIAYSKLNLSASIVNADIATAAAIAYSKLALTGTIVNADIASSAAIAYSKLSLTGSILNVDISASAAIVYSKLSLTGSIVNADISTSAAIAYSKLNLATSIVNADVNAAAAIVYSKLSLGNSIVNADIATGAAIAYSKLSLTGGIVNADVNASAAIAYSKLALTGAIVYADLAAGAAKIKAYDKDDTLLSSVVNEVRAMSGLQVEFSGQKMTIKSIRLSSDDSASATTPGTVTDKVPMYDSSNTLIGYIAIYDAIT